MRVRSGLRALDAVRAFRPDLILPDILLPDLDGASIAAGLSKTTIRETFRWCSGPARVQARCRADRRWLGGHPFLAKPLKPEEVLKVVEEYLDYKKKIGDLRLAI